MRNLKMLTGLSGPELTLSPGDEHEFEDAEADRLIEAGFATEAEGSKPPAPAKKPRAKA